MYYLRILFVYACTIKTVFIGYPSDVTKLAAKYGEWELIREKIPLHKGPTGIFHVSGSVSVSALRILIKMEHVK